MRPKRKSRRTNGNGRDWQQILLDHVLQCDECLAVIADPRLSTTECAVRCACYRSLLRMSEFEEQENSRPRTRTAG